MLLDTARDTEGLVTTVNGKIDATIVDAVAKLKIIASYAVGFGNIDITEATKRHVVASNTPTVLTLDNVVIVPHLASASFTTRGNMSLMATENLLAGLRGQTPPNCVSSETPRY